MGLTYNCFTEIPPALAAATRLTCLRLEENPGLHLAMQGARVLGRLQRLHRCSIGLCVCVCVVWQWWVEGGGGGRGCWLPSARRCLPGCAGAQLRLFVLQLPGTPLPSARAAASRLREMLPAATCASRRQVHWEQCRRSH